MFCFLTGYSFWDRLHNFLPKFTRIFCQFISWTNWVNSGKFMDNCWILCQIVADMENFWDDLIIINLYPCKLLRYLRDIFGSFNLIEVLKVQNHIMKKQMRLSKGFSPHYDKQQAGAAVHPLVLSTILE